MNATYILINVILIAVPASKVQNVFADLFAVGPSVGPLLEETTEGSQPSSRAHHDNGSLWLKWQPIIK